VIHQVAAIGDCQVLDLVEAAECERGRYQAGEPPPFARLIDASSDAATAPPANMANQIPVSASTVAVSRRTALGDSVISDPPPSRLVGFSVCGNDARRESVRVPKQ
jgi:hypothetical protein